MNTSERSIYACSSGSAPDRFYFFESTGSLRALLDANANVLSRAAYSAWGTPLAGYTPPTPFGYKGKYGPYRDNETGLLCCGARYYAPFVGRWLARDPSGFGAGPNLYAYCIGDPVDLFDANGCAPEGTEPAQQGGVANWIDNHLTGGSAGNFGGVSGEYEGGKANAWDVAGAGLKYAANLAAAGFLVKDLATAGVRAAGGMAGGAAGGADAARQIGADLGPGCFAGGTPVTFAASDNNVDTLLAAFPASSASGSLATETRPIETAQAGQTVISRNPSTGQTEARRIVSVSHSHTDRLLAITLCDAITGQPVETIEATRQHPFYVEGKGFVAAAALGIGNAIVTRAGPPLVVGAMAWERRAEGYDVYNLIVEGDHTYFVGDSGGGVWVHNGDGTCFSEAEESIAEYLRGRGDTVSHNPLEGTAGAGRQGDAIVNGEPHEFKTVTKPNANANTIRNTVNDSAKRRGQAPTIVFDVRGTSMPLSEAQYGARQALGGLQKVVKRIIIIGKGYHYDSH